MSARRRKPMPKWLKICLIVLSAVVGIFVVVPRLKRLLNTLKSKMKNGTWNNGTQGDVNLVSIAEQIYAAFYDNFWGDEDEEKAVGLLLQIPNGSVPTVASHYSNIKGKGENMYADFVKYVINDWNVDAALKSKASAKLN